MLYLPKFKKANRTAFVLLSPMCINIRIVLQSINDMPLEISILNQINIWALKFSAIFNFGYNAMYR